MLDKIKQLRQPSWGNAARADLLSGGVEQTAQLAIDPVGSDLGARASLALLALVAHRDDGLEVVSYLALDGELVGVVGGETILRDEALAPGVGEFRHARADLLDALSAEGQRRQIGLWEVTVVVSE